MQELGTYIHREALDQEDDIDFLNSCDPNCDNAIPTLMAGVNTYLLDIPQIKYENVVAPNVIYLDGGKENANE